MQQSRGCVLAQRQSYEACKYGSSASQVEQHSRREGTPANVSKHKQPKQSLISDWLPKQYYASDAQKKRTITKGEARDNG
jgi:hypothetical protein